MKRAVDPIVASPPAPFISAAVRAAAMSSALNGVRPQNLGSTFAGS
jgi:hypothetical protein